MSKSEGISKREYFASNAPENVFSALAIIEGKLSYSEPEKMQCRAALAVLYADALIAELEKVK